MHRLYKIAQYNSSSKSADLSDQLYFTKGEFIFGKTENDQLSSCEFYICLLNFIEKWAALYSNDSQNNYSFTKVYKSLKKKKIVFPSEQNKIQKNDKGKKHVNFYKSDDETMS